MITLGTDQGFVRVETWQEVTELPGFTIDLDPKTVELQSIVASYQFGDEVACGLSSCHTAHNKGYVVEVKDGRLTNIGHNCGEKYFSVKFKEMSRTFERALRRQDNYERVVGAKNQIPSIEAEIQAMRDGGLDAIYHSVSTMKSRAAGALLEVVRAVSKMVRNQDPSIYVERELSNEEAEVARAAGDPNAEFTAEEVGILDGLSALYDTNDIRPILIKDLAVNLRALAEFDPDYAKDKDLAGWAKWWSEISGKIDQLRVIERQARRLFTQENIAQLVALVDHEDDYRRVMVFAERFPRRDA